MKFLLDIRQLMVSLKSSCNEYSSIQTQGVLLQTEGQCKVFHYYGPNISQLPTCCFSCLITICWQWLTLKTWDYCCFSGSWPELWHLSSPQSCPAGWKRRKNVQMFQKNNYNNINNNNNKRDIYDIYRLSWTHSKVCRPRLCNNASANALAPLVPAETPCRLEWEQLWSLFTHRGVNLRAD